MSNTKALTLAHLQEARKHMNQVTREHEVDMLRTQLAEQDTLIQKHLSTLTSLEAAVKERDAQLAAVKEAASLFNTFLAFLEADSELLDEELPDTAVVSHASGGGWSVSIEVRHLRKLRDATRQPTQDKGKL